jgi:hypothetical protein
MKKISSKIDVKKKVEAKNGCENIYLNDLNELIRFKEEASKKYMKIWF